MTELFQNDYPGFADIQLIITAPNDVDIKTGDTIRLESPTSTTRIRVGHNIKARKGEQFAVSVKGRLEMFIERKE